MGLIATILAAMIVVEAKDCTDSNDACEECCEVELGPRWVAILDEDQCKCSMAGVTHVIHSVGGGDDGEVDWSDTDDVE